MADKYIHLAFRDTQRQFSKNICSEDDLRNFRNICCKISCLPASPRIFEHLKNGIIAQFKQIFYPKKVTALEFSGAFLWLKLSKR